MKKYLYVFNYENQKKDLCALEFESLFHDQYQSKYYLTDQDIDHNISIFIKAKIDIFYQNKDFRVLLEDVIESGLEYEDFKIIYLKNETYHIDYRDSLQKCRSLSYGIGGSVNMAHPKHTLAFTKINDLWIFGYYHHGRPTWQAFEKKPRSFSNSLPVDLARTIVNIAFGNNHQLKGIDPCCGMGTVVLEALALGYDMRGYDISRDISYSARVNLRHFGFDEFLINRSPIQEIKDVYDVAIIDLPYNHYTPITPQQQYSIIESSYAICHQLVLVTSQVMDDEVIRAGYRIARRVKVGKGHYETFQRYIYVLKKSI